VFGIALCFSECRGPRVCVVCALHSCNSKHVADTRGAGGKGGGPPPAGNLHNSRGCWGPRSSHTPMGAPFTPKGAQCPDQSCNRVAPIYALHVLQH
jgi:hypothetical protein